VTDVSIRALVQLDGIVFDVGADAFIISNTPRVVLTISGVGITNNSGVLQNFVNQQNLRSGGQLYFTNGATAGDSVIYTNQTAERSGTIFPLIQFEDNSTAGTAQFINMAGGGFSRAGVIEFQGNSTAGNGTFQNTGVSGQNSPEINFRDQASAGEAVITNEESTSSFVTFYDNSTADHATITNEAHFGGGFVFFTTTQPQQTRQSLTKATPLGMVTPISTIPPPQATASSSSMVLLLLVSDMVSWA